MFTTDYRPFDGNVDPRAIPRLGGHRVTAARLKEIVEGTDFFRHADGRRKGPGVSMGYSGAKILHFS
jgi:hypothetical protein